MQRLRATARVAIGEGMFLRRSLALISGTVLSQAIVFLCSPILSRIFDPGDFGALANFNAWVTFLVLLSNLRYEHAIIVAHRRVGVTRVLALVATLSAVSTVIVGVVAAVLYVVDPPGYLHDVRSVLPFIPFAMVPASLSSALANFNVRTGQFNRLASATVVAAGGTIGLQLLLGVLHIPHGLIYGTILGTMISSAMLLAGFLRRHRLSHVTREMSAERLRLTAIEHLDFPRYTLTGDAIAVVVQQFVPVFLLAMYNPVIAGLYAFATRAIRVPLVVVSSAVSNVLRREAPLHLAREGDLRTIYRGTIRSLGLLALPPLLVLGLFGPQLFTLVFGSKWADAGRIARILSPGMMLEFVAFPLTILFIVTRRQQVTLRLQVTGFLMLFAAVFIGRRVTTDFFSTCMLISGAMILVNAATIVLAARASKRAPEAAQGV